MVDRFYCFCIVFMFWYTFSNNGGDIRRWSMEPEQNSWLGLGHHQLRLVDRYWSRRNIDLSDLIIIPSGLENWCEPCSRSDDNFCGNVCGSISNLAYGSCVGCLLRITLSKYKRPFV